MNNEVKVKICTLDDAKEFSSICELFDISIDYIIGRYVIDAASMMGILSTSLGKMATVKVHSDNMNIVDSFYDCIAKWIVEE